MPCMIIYVPFITETLFGVFVFRDERNVKVYRLSERSKENVSMPKKMKWELVDDIGDNVLYLSHVSCFVCPVDTKIKANRIYFPLLHGDSAVFYSLNDRKYHSLNGDYSSNHAYGLKRSNFAVWVTPSLITTTSEPELRWASKKRKWINMEFIYEKFNFVISCFGTVS
ncbi:hypothetical protein CASFOL_015812 [Castilleja foliolosa]|uniref:KIB1-4 beta-propeller domain-containing protein n=1 Tax=Castilleja foliolosa TaxID=1961234 RepID=A0ABD3DG94_9LAMI